MSKKNTTVEESGVINQPLNNAELGDNGSNVPATQPKKGKNGKKNENKVGFGTKVKNFFKGIVSELKKVTWPTAGKVFAQFGTVCFVVLVFVLIIMGFDYLCGWLLKLLIGA